METFDQQIDEALTERGPRTGPASVLVLAGEQPCSEHILCVLRLRGHDIVQVSDILAAERHLKSAAYEVLLVDANLAVGHDLLRRLPRAVKTIALSGDTSTHAIVQVIRSGAQDVVLLSGDRTFENIASELADRVEAALYLSRVEQGREERLRRLKRICRELNVARHQITEQVDVLCHDLVCAYQDLSAQIDDVAMATEFRTLVRQELDVEELLKTTLEYALTKTGPTNAAVFLAEGMGAEKEFGLGAYVNYDCPRESISTVLDKLCHAICPQMAAEQEIVSFEDAAEFAAWVGIDSGMFAQSQVVAFSCFHQGECLAIIVLFRSKSAPFQQELAGVIDTLRPIFAEQLTRVLTTHHRAQPDWPRDAHAAEDEDWGLDDQGFGFGGMAA